MLLYSLLVLSFLSSAQTLWQWRLITMLTSLRKARVPPWSVKLSLSRALLPGKDQNGMEHGIKWPLGTSWCWAEKKIAGCTVAIRHQMPQAYPIRSTSFPRLTQVKCLFLHVIEQINEYLNHCKRLIYSWIWAAQGVRDVVYGVSIFFSFTQGVGVWLQLHWSWACWPCSSSPHWFCGCGSTESKRHPAQPTKPLILMTMVSGQKSTCKGMWDYNMTQFVSVTFLFFFVLVFWSSCVCHLLIKGPK